MTEPTSHSARPEVRHSPAAVSIDALMRQWARQEAAPAGVAYVVDREISARRRGGELWQHLDAIAVAVLARPQAIDIASVDLLWIAASLGAADALGTLTQRDHGCIWPDRVEADPGLDVAITAVDELGPGRIDRAVLIVRVAPSAAVGAATEVATALVDSLRSASALLDDPDQLVRRYNDRCVNIGQNTSASLLPRGSVRGIATGIDPSGALVITSPTGLAESIAVPILDQLHAID